MSRRPHFDLSEFMPYLVNRVGTAIAERFTGVALAPFDLNIAMWRVLVVLGNDDGQRQIDLADLTSIDASTLSRLVTRMERMGLIARARSPVSNREVLVRLTPKGRDILRRLIPKAREQEAIVIASLSPRDLAVVKASLRRMYANMSGSERAAISAGRKGRGRAAGARGNVNSRRQSAVDAP